MLQVDPDLAADLAPDQRSRAAQASAAPLRVFSPGEWRFQPPPDPASLGALILGGMVVLRVELAGCGHLEVLGGGDVVNPWLLGTESLLEEQVGVRVIRGGAVALLDRRFALQMSPWPEVFAALMRRQIMRMRRMAVQAAILSMPRVDERIELTLWQLAEQFGRVTRDGLLVTLPFTHGQLAEMIGAQRSTVTLAINRLVAENRLRRPGRTQWLLPQNELTRLKGASAALDAGEHGLTGGPGGPA